MTTPTSQLIAELRELPKQGANLYGRLMDMYADPHIDDLTFSAAKHIARIEASMLRAAEALARQEELLAEAGEVVEPFAATAAVLGQTKDSAVWAGQRPAPPITFGAFRAAARLSDKLKGE